MNNKENKVLLKNEAPREPQLETKQSIYAHLTLAMNDVKLGKTQNADEVFDSIITELKNLNQ